MPFKLSHPEQLPGPCLRIEASEQVELADGETLAAELARIRGEFPQQPKILGVVNKGTRYSSEVRKFFPTMSPGISAMALVVTSPLVRGAVNLILRLRRPADGPTRMFTDEAEAYAWLEEQPFRERAEQ